MSRGAAASQQGQGLAGGSIGLAGGLTALFLAAALAAPAPAAARQPLETAIQDDAQLLHRPEAQIRASLQQIRDLGIERVRVTAGWSILTRDPDAEAKPDFDLADPAAYEQEKWRNLDRLVRLTREYGLKTMIDIAFWAPHWATGDSPGPRARTNIDADHYRDFAVAVVRRYGGGFAPPAQGGGPGGGGGDGGDGDGGDDDLGDDLGLPSADEQLLEDLFGGLDGGEGDGGEGGQTAQGGGQGTRRGGGQTAPQGARGEPLPKVSMYTLWNEPNHPGFLMPQWRREGGALLAESPHIYRRLLYTAYPAVKEAAPDSIVLVGATSSMGSHDGSGRGGVPPLRFIRELACVDEQLRPLGRAECGGFRQVPGDGWAHHPYSLTTPPGARNRPNRPDNAPIGELDRLSALLDRLIAAGRLSPALRNLYLTEYGYETNPPDPGERFSLADQARFLPWAEYLAWRDPDVRMHAQFLLRDLPPRERAEGSSPRRAFGTWQSGLLFADGRPKPAAESFKAGIFAQRRPGSDRVVLWGRVRPGSGARQARIEVRGRGAAWVALPTASSASRARAAGAPAFASATDGTFRRVARSLRGARYRLSYLSGGRWRPTIAVRPVEAPVPAAPRPAPKAG